MNSKNEEDGVDFLMEDHHLEQVLIENGNYALKNYHSVDFKHKSRVELLIKPLVNILGAISCTTAQNFSTRLISAGACEFLVKCLEADIKSLWKDSAWVLSNIFCENISEFHKILTNEYLMEKIVGMLCKFDDQPTKLELARLFLNLTNNPNKIRFVSLLYHCKDTIFYAFLDCLNPSNDTRIILVALDMIKNILCLGKKLMFSGSNVNEIKGVLLEQENIMNLENLQNHPDSEIFERVSN